MVLETDIRTQIIVEIVQGSEGHVSLVSVLPS